MKITHEIISIEADARQLRESNTIAGNFASMLSMAFQSREPFEESEEENVDEIDEDNA